MNLPLEIKTGNAWDVNVPASLIEKIENLISWKTIHTPDYYKAPGRTMVFYDHENNLHIKIKGAGYFNPSNIPFSGLKRTVTPVPEGASPKPPLEEAFKRDIIHVDPGEEFPYNLKSVQSYFAPIGGMTHRVAQNDQLIFDALTKVGLPANKPLATYIYPTLFLGKEQMGVSVSLLPESVLNITPFDIYMAWHSDIQEPAASLFLKNYLGRSRFSILNADDRLAAICKFAYQAGQLIFKFSANAGLFRFSGSPDNWNIKSDIDSPLYFSDVDTCRSMDNIPPEQGPWEVLRNLLTAIHQWTYYFLPSLAYPASQYSFERLQRYDFIKALLTGFFSDTGPEITKLAKRIWKVLQPVCKNIPMNEGIQLRRGEHYLQHYYTRPTFYFILLHLMKHIIPTSKLADVYNDIDLSEVAIDNYINSSIRDESHELFFPQYSIEETVNLLSKMG